VCRLTKEVNSDCDVIHQDNIDIMEDINVDTDEGMGGHNKVNQ
jgi:hypothetical protein